MPIETGVSASVNARGPAGAEPIGRVAILAGGGALPGMVAASVLARGGEVYVVALEGFADKYLEAYPHTWVNPGQVDRIMRALAGPKDRTGPNCMVIAGAAARPDLGRIRPDWGVPRLLPEVFRLIAAGGDDALLTRLIRLFESRGLVVKGVQDLVPDLLIAEGRLGAHSADVATQADLVLAERLLAVLGPHDVGQGAVVADGRVLAIEGIEGTDRMLARVATLPERAQAGKSGLLLKAPKPGQERRVDLPTVGPRTITALASARLAGLAVRANDTIGLERADMIAAADTAGLFVMGVGRPADAVASILQPATPRFQARELGRVRLRAGDTDDAAIAAAVAADLTPFDTGHTVAVVRGHILAVGAADTASDVLARIGRHRPWGLKILQRRRGVLLVRGDATRPHAFDPRPLIEGLAASNLAALVLTGSAELASLEPQHVQAADAAGLAVAARGL